jgi:hypothetical protein
MYWMAPPTLMRKMAHPDESVDLGSGAARGRAGRQPAGRLWARWRGAVGPRFRAARQETQPAARGSLAERDCEAVPCP